MSVIARNSAITFNAFNTGRLYTEAGQRIAWTVLSTGNVAMYDVDRMIDYVLSIPRAAGSVPTNVQVLHAYDFNLHPEFNSEERHEARELEKALVNVARAVKGIKA